MNRLKEALEFLVILLIGYIIGAYTMYEQGVKDGVAATVKRTNFLIDSTLHVKDAFYFSKKDTVFVEKNTYIESAKNVTIGQ